MDVPDEDRLLPMPTAFSLTRAQLQRQGGELTYAQWDEALTVELAAHEDLRPVVDALAVLCALLGRAAEGMSVDGMISAEAILLGLERGIARDES